MTSRLTEPNSWQWSDNSVREALGLPESPAVRPTMPFSGVSTDTRTVHPGNLYLALRGERFDGHDFLSGAAKAGATAAVVRRGTPPVAGLVLYEVPDTLCAYGELARARRRALSGPVIAITGSNGKTSTKEMIAAVLKTTYRTHATRANDNNLVGIPLTILSAPEDTQALVLEAGANQLGEISRAREIIEPTVAVVTNVSPAHLEGFGSVATVMREKLALTDRVPLAIVGTDPPGLVAEARRHAKRVVSAGLAGADRVPTLVDLDRHSRPTLTIDGVTIALPVLGRHQAANAMLAWTVVQELGLDPGKAADALERLALPAGRGELQQVAGLTILNDAYNANPASFRAAIATTAAMRVGRRLVFVAGTMRELGEDAPRLHAEIAKELVQLRPELLAAVGDFATALSPYAAELGDALITAPDAASLAPQLVKRLHGDELVVLKGSRGVALERIIPHLTSPATPER